ncbi:nuclear transport factor 2 family protein [Leifsonia shinshuensis]|uniref:nuclear transport factor 2 family protein n=1 Tax=Leifsonia shinshuensis TaxID=150026 RepID=UPI001F50783C|nr:nuclear transport factor 2 family protein [Leifsonia shinshuensis]MCI0156360.1 nuclear transport factor 2 family protein [Leifsonia shinshuensis]
MTREQQSAAIARQYIEAVGAHDLETVGGLLADDLSAIFAGAAFGRDEWLGALNRLLPALVRNDLREVFADGDRACVVYDFVTDTAAGAVPCVELVTVAGDAITRIELIFDRVAFAPVNEALARRAAP